jgi:hypothetical protein
MGRYEHIARADINTKGDMQWERTEGKKPGTSC